MCFVWISKQTAVISLHSINWLVFITETECLLRGTDWVFIYNSTFCPHSVFMCFVWIWEQTAVWDNRCILLVVCITMHGPENIKFTARQIFQIFHRAWSCLTTIPAFILTCHQNQSPRWSFRTNQSRPVNCRRQRTLYNLSFGSFFAYRTVITRLGKYLTL